jgi:hypothetical protein
VFVIYARDEYGNRLVFGGDHFSVLVAGPSVVTPNINDNGDGTYTCSVCPQTPGNYTVQVKINGLDIQGSPCALYLPGIIITSHHIRKSFTVCVHYC